MEEQSNAILQVEILAPAIEEWLGGWSKAGAKLETLDEVGAHDKSLEDGERATGGNATAQLAYRDWLRSLMDKEGHGALPTSAAIEDGPDNLSRGHTSLYALKATSKTSFGHRELQQRGVRDTVRKLLVQAHSGGWRDYDLAHVCIIENEATGSNDYFLIKLHYRSSSLHLIMSYMHATAKTPHTGLLHMCQKIPYAFHGKLTKVCAVARGLQYTHAMTQSVKPHYLDIVFQGLNRVTMGSSPLCRRKS